MYLWVVLATFIVAILSYNLSVRPDMDRTYMETKAKTAIARFKLQHTAFYSYIDSKRLKLDEQAVPGAAVDYVSRVGYNNGHVIGTQSDKIKAEDIESFLPAGYTPRSDIYSKVFCFQKDGNNSLEAEYGEICETASGGTMTCCSKEDTIVYVASWQQIPSNWLNKSGKPTSDMMLSIAKTDGYGKTFGYNQTKDSEDTSQESQNLPDYPVISGGFGYGINDTDTTFSLKYQRIFKAILDDEHYHDQCAHNTCFVALQRVQNREGLTEYKARCDAEGNCSITTED